VASESCPDEPALPSDAEASMPPSPAVSAFVVFDGSAVGGEDHDPADGSVTLSRAMVAASALGTRHSQDFQAPRSHCATALPSVASQASENSEHGSPMLPGMLKAPSSQSGRSGECWSSLATCGRTHPQLKQKQRANERTSHEMRIMRIVYTR